MQILPRVRNMQQWSRILYQGGKLLLQRSLDYGSGVRPVQAELLRVSNMQILPRLRDLQQPRNLRWRRQLSVRPRIRWRGMQPMFDEPLWVSNLQVLPRIRDVQR